MQFQSLIVLALSAAGALAAGNTLQARSNGLGTIYTQEGGTGSCGQAHADSDMIVAIATDYMSQGGMCGRQIQITNVGSDDGVGGAGNTATATIADTCPSCDDGHVDMSVGVWNAVTGGAAWGTVNIEWDFI
ncbi:hypothetical protein G7Y89_g3303 [Cudoniella acicularis]|uniref:Uncharacterized protein n=1 Tax=Cudoniella acicularis TaxID=354080 RepID=A0A8H4W8I1_9HELO|nr:hypothetical protein G7Y89_g3303 [Cudoniella acicularis]